MLIGSKNCLVIVLLLAAVVCAAPDTLATDKVLHDQFMREVENFDDVAGQKTHWEEVYIGLSRAETDIQAAREKIRSEKNMSHDQVYASLAAEEAKLSDKLGHLHALKYLAVRQYGLSRQLEKLGGTPETRSLTKAELLQQRKEILGELARIEETRIWLNKFADLGDALRAIQSELADLTAATRLNVPPAPRP